MLYSKGERCMGKVINKEVIDKLKEDQQKDKQIAELKESLIEAQNAINALLGV